MHPPDDTPYPLARPKRTPQPPRAVRKQDFSLPKPYRRQLFSEEPESLTRLQKGLLAFATLLVATLAGIMALLAHENARSPQGKVIVAAARIESLEPGEAQLASYAAPTAPLPRAPARATPPALAGGAAMLTPRARAKGAAASPRLAAAIKKTAAAPVPRAPGRHKSPHPKPQPKAVRKEPPLAPPPADPDVVLITAILLLTPAPVPAAAPAVSMEAGGRAPCSPVRIKENSCSDSHPTKP